MLSVSELAGADPSPVLVEQTTSFLQEDNSASIDLAQSGLIETANVGAGEPSAQSTIFYAAPNGNGNGSQGNPWSLAQANSQLRAGDTLYLTAGTYIGSIEPTANGNSNNPIRFTVVPGLNPDDVHISHGDEGSIGSTRKPTVKIRKDFIIVDGFTVSFKNGLKKNQAFASNIDVTGDHVTIRNMRIIHDATEADGPLTQGQLGEHVRQARQSNNTKELGVSVNGSFGLYENNLIQDMWLGMAVNTKVGHSHNVIRGNTVADSIIDGIRLGKTDGTPLSYLIENNIIFGSHLSHGITLEGVTNPVTKVIIRNNAIFNNAELGIALKGSKEIVIEGNFFWGMIGDTDGSGVLIGNGAQTALENSEGTSGTISTALASFPDENVIIRNNVGVDSNQGTIAQTNFKIYSNTFLNNRRNFTGPNQPTAPLSANKPADSGIKASNIGPNAAILNNVFGDHGYEITLRPGTNATVDGNTYYNTFQTPRFGEYGGNGAGNWSSHTLSSWQSWLQSRPSISGNEAHSQVVSGGSTALFTNVPGQVTGDPAQFDFRLKANSPAIDSGVFLTKTVGSGSNKTTMSVADAKLFFDGYGITLGDEIQLAGQTARARITNISGNTLTLDTPLSWSSGKGVSLAYEGNSPDAGAIEFGTSTGPGTTNGDFDSDGDTDGADFLAWQRGFGTTYTSDDLTDWQSNFGSSAPVNEVVVNFDQVTISNYAGLSSAGSSATVSNGGATLTVSGDAWKSIPLNHTVTANTVIEFDFQSPTQGDIHAIGFDSDDVPETNRTLRFHGTQNTVGISTVPQYSGSGVQHFKLRIGDYGAYELGNVDRLFFVNDHDSFPFNAVGIFSNVRIYDEAAAVATGSAPAFGADSEAVGVEPPAFILADEMFSPVASQTAAGTVLDEVFSDSDEPASDLLGILDTLAIAQAATSESNSSPTLAQEQLEEEEENGTRNFIFQTLGDSVA